MGKIDDYRTFLRQMTSWDSFLSEYSGLPGPRGNLELAYAVAEEGGERVFTDLLSHDNPGVLENTPQVFLVFCGVVGLGKLLSQGQLHWQKKLREYANDPRWRIREAVAIALQLFAPTNPSQFMAWMKVWAEGSLLEQRAAVAALCEPSLLVEKDVCRTTLEILDTITSHITTRLDHRSEDFRILRQTLGYGWSVAIAASFELGKMLFEAWIPSSDPDIRWILKENLSKNRLKRLDSTWTDACLERIKKTTDTR